MRQLVKKIKEKLSRILFTVKVYGESCWPELVPGRKYLATSLIKPKIGDYVVFMTKHGEIFVKKVTEIKNNSYFVEGRVSWSESSKNLGLINRENVIGKLMFY